MNRIIFAIVLAVSFLSFSSGALAAGVFEMNEFSDSYTAIAGEPFNAHFSFYYSGTTYIPKVSVVSDSFPGGVSLGALKTEGVSFYSIDYSGIPTTPGGYSIKLMLTDDYGALLVKKFTINVQGLVFNTTTLPNAIINKEYVQDIYFNYPSTKIPRIIFVDFPRSIYPQVLDPNGFNQHVTLKFIPRQVGQFAIKAIATVDMKDAGKIELGSQFFNVMVENEVPIIPSKQVTTTLVPTPAPVISTPSTISPRIIAPTVTPPVKPKEVIINLKTVVVEKPTEKIIATTSPDEVTPIITEQEVKTPPIPPPAPKPFWFRVMSWFKFW